MSRSFFFFSMVLNEISRNAQKKLLFGSDIADLSSLQKTALAWSVVFPFHFL